MSIHKARYAGSAKCDQLCHQLFLHNQLPTCVQSILTSRLQPCLLITPPIVPPLSPLAAKHSCLSVLLFLHTLKGVLKGFLKGVLISMQGSSAPGRGYQVFSWQHIGAVNRTRTGLCLAQGLVHRAPAMSPALAFIDAQL